LTEAKVEPYKYGTGYWDITDHQHPDYQGNVCALYRETVTTELPVLSLDTEGVSTLTGDPTLSPFFAPAAVASPATQATRSPSFTEPRSQEEEQSIEEETLSGTEEEPSPD